MVIHHLRFVFLATCHLQIVASQTSLDQPQYANFSASVTVIIFLVVTSVLFAGFFAIYFRHCADRSSASGGTVRPIAGIRNAARGLDATLTETFPTFPYSEVKHLKIGKGALECAVCLNEFEDEETLRLLPKCDHVFHSECIDAWLSSHATCPVCRANLAEVPVETTLPVESDVPAPLGSVSIQVAEEEEVVNAADDGGPVNRARPVKSRSIKSMIFSKFPRSHSTGHSLVRPGENVDRFTLRLPDQVRREIMARALNRTTSLLVLPRETSSRRGYRTDGEGSSRGKSYWRLGSLDRPDRWVFSMTPPFLARESSITLQKKNPSTSGGQGSSKRFNLVGRLSFNRFGGSRSEPGS